MIKYTILPLGFFKADGGAMFGSIPKRAWSRKFPADDKNRCALAMNACLLIAEDRLILIDTGVGSKDLGKLSYYDFFDEKDIRQVIIEQGYSPEDITDVILSHLHFDHCGGCTYYDNTNTLQVSFPNAKHYVGKKQWESFNNPNDLEKSSFRKQDLMPIYENGLLQWVDTPFELIPNCFIDLYDGHTLGQLAVRFQADNEFIFYPGDVIPTKAHLSDEWISAYDIEPLKSLESKRKIKQQAQDVNARFVFYHG